MISFLIEALLLEDLSIREFVSMKKENCMNKRESKLLDYEHASLALRYLGKYHANSFIVREKRPDIFEKLQAIEEPLFLNPERSSPYVHMILNIIKPVRKNNVKLCKLDKKSLGLIRCQTNLIADHR